ncbi:MAG: hypothetical protein ABJF10_12050 [Chthoniobacter sp.]|uniref:hypothetical protein n=1 Tax=Chthoniobacter sp. TaxID=2510640 RepID=UPI0032A3D654
MISIEFEPPTTDAKPCECCGGLTTRLTRFVYRDDDAYAVYYALFTDHPPHSHISVLVSIGEWADDAPPSGRRAFHLRIGTDADNFNVTVRDAAESPWGEVPLFGRTLNRDEALAHPRLKEVFHISDHIVTQDTPIVGHLSKATGND